MRFSPEGRPNPAASALLLFSFGGLGGLAPGKDGADAPPDATPRLGPRLFGARRARVYVLALRTGLPLPPLSVGGPPRRRSGAGPRRGAHGDFFGRDARRAGRRGPPLGRRDVP